MHLRFRDRVSKSVGLAVAGRRGGESRLRIS